MGLPADWGMSEEVKPIPDSYFLALYEIREAYRVRSAGWIPPYNICETPPVGSQEWKDLHSERVSGWWGEYKQALDSLLDDIEGRVRFRLHSQDKYTAD